MNYKAGIRLLKMKRDNKIRNLVLSNVLTIEQIANVAGVSRNHVYVVIRQYGLVHKRFGWVVK